MIFGNSKIEQEVLEQIKLGYAVLNNPKVKFAWLPVQIKAIKEHIDEGKWIWFEKYISYKDKFAIGYYYNGSDGYGEIYAIRKITRLGFFDDHDQKTYVVKYDKDFESDKFTLLGFCQTKKLVEEYIRKLERWFCNEQ